MIRYLGYPCINLSLECRSSKTFRLASYTEEKLVQTIEDNLKCLLQILEFNKKQGLLFFRISSDLIPFASHAINSFPWQAHFKDSLSDIGEYIKKNKMRISMHPDQFVLLNSPTEQIYKNSVSELVYHDEVLTLLGLDSTAKIQIHVGGVYGDKLQSMQRFCDRYNQLPLTLKKRLVIENDDRLYSVTDCLSISEQVGIPVLFDNLHHTILPGQLELIPAMEKCFATWRVRDGLPLIDYSQQQGGKRIGNHAVTLESEQFRSFIEQTKNLEYDLMFEIKDKETSALRALSLLTTFKK